MSPFLVIYCFPFAIYCIFIISSFSKFYLAKPILYLSNFEVPRSDQTSHYKWRVRLEKPSTILKIHFLKLCLYGFDQQGTINFINITLVSQELYKFVSSCDVFFQASSLSFNFFHNINLNNVSFFNVIVFFYLDSALETFCYFFYVIFETF